MHLQIGEIENFWQLIEGCPIEHQSAAQADWMVGQLSRKALVEVFNFDFSLQNFADEIGTYDLFGALYSIFGYGSDDSFLSFRFWLISLGRAKFDLVRSDPDSIVTIPEVIDYASATAKDPLFPEMSLIAFRAFRQITGLDYDSYLREFDTIHPDAPSALEVHGEPWDISSNIEILQRLPKIADRFNIRA